MSSTTGVPYKGSKPKLGLKTQPQRFIVLQKYILCTIHIPIHNCLTLFTMVCLTSSQLLMVPSTTTTCFTCMCLIHYNHLLTKLSCLEYQTYNETNSVSSSLSSYSTSSVPQFFWHITPNLPPFVTNFRFTYHKLLHIFLCVKFLSNRVKDCL